MDIKVVKVQNTKSKDYFIDDYSGSNLNHLSKSTKDFMESNETEITVLKDNLHPLDNISVAKYVSAIECINSQDEGYNLLNGRFRVDEYYGDKGLQFIYVITNNITGLFYADTSINPINKLYRLFVNGGGYRPLKEDIDFLGKDNFYVRVHGPYSVDDLSDELYKIVKKKSNETGSNLYNPSIYDDMLDYEDY